MFEELNRIFEKPEPFQFYTAQDLWTDPHTSRQMLAYHLDGSVDISSRNQEFIGRSVKWITSLFEKGEKASIADFGCGPGLYAVPLARLGHSVTGIDFSKRSVDHARETAAREGLTVAFVNGNYLDYETAERFDLILMIMCDFCALSPAQRKALLGKFHWMLKPSGSILLDGYSLRGFQEKEETYSLEAKPFGGFWSQKGYFCFLNTFKYEAEAVSLDKFTIVESCRTRHVYNWLQYFSPEAMELELAVAGFEVKGFYADVAGTPFDKDSKEFAVIASKN